MGSGHHGISPVDKSCGHNAIAIEAGIEASVGVVPRECGPPSIPGSRHNFAIRLKGNVQDPAEVARVGNDLSIAAEGSIQRAIGVVSRQAEMCVEDIRSRGPCHDDLAVGLDRHAVADIVGAAEIRCGLSIGVEAGVKAAIGIVSGQGKVVRAAVEGIPCQDDLAIGAEKGAEKGVTLNYLRIVSLVMEWLFPRCCE